MGFRVQSFHGFPYYTPLYYPPPLGSPRSRALEGYVSLILFFKGGTRVGSIEAGSRETHEV